MIESAERFIRTLTGIEVLRVRLEEGELARIEVPVESVGNLMKAESRGKIVEELLKLGFRQVTLDLQGFRSGSLNEALPFVSLDVPSES